MALVVIVGLWTVMMTAAAWSPRFWDWLEHDGRWLLFLAVATLPGGLTGAELHTVAAPMAWAVVAWFGVVHAALAVWYVHRFGRVAERRVRSPQPVAFDRAHPGWLAPPRRTPWSAIIWKQFRESGPIALVGLAGALAIGAVATIVVAREPAAPAGEYLTVFLVVSFFAGMYLGGISTLVIGIGAYLRDLEPRLHTFWRSRPISPDAWYWTKCATGLAVVLLAFQLPMLLVPAKVPMEWLGGDINSAGELLRMQLYSLLVFLAAYGAAVGTTSLVRNAVYAAILSIGALALGSWTAAATVEIGSKALGHKLPPMYFDSPESTPVYMTGLAVVAIVGTLVGWLAVRYDWGRKSRY
jgi:hypothetical protein